MTIAEAKKNYNKMLERFIKAEQYFDRKDISQEEKEKQLENFEVVLKGLNYLLSKIGVYSEWEMLNGFHSKKEVSE